jgi:hypothetical protein
MKATARANFVASLRKHLRTRGVTDRHAEAECHSLAAPIGNLSLRTARSSESPHDFPQVIKVEGLVEHREGAELCSSAMSFF